MYYHKWGNLLEVRAQDGDVLHERGRLLPRRRQRVVDGVGLVAEDERRGDVRRAVALDGGELAALLDDRPVDAGDRASSNSPASNSTSQLSTWQSAALLISSSTALRSSVARARSRRAIAARTSGASAGRPAASAKGSAASIWSRVCAASSASAACGHGPLARRALLVVGPQFVFQSLGCGKLESVVRYRFHGLQGRGPGRQ